MNDKANPFREFLNIAGNLFDQYEIGEDGEPVVWKSEELLELMGKFKQWNDEFGEVMVSEDDLDYFKARNPAITKLIEIFDLKTN